MYRAEVPMLQHWVLRQGLAFGCWGRIPNFFHTLLTHPDTPGYCARRHTERSPARFCFSHASRGRGTQPRDLSSART